MYIIVEGYRYQTEAAKVVLQKIHPLEQDRAISMYYVGYYYSNELNDTIFFLPKVVIDENGKLFGNPKYDPEKLINLSKSLENGNIDPTDYDFIYGLSVWIYRAISEFKEQQKRQTENGEIEETTIVYNRSIANVSHVGDDVSNTYLDIMLSLIRFSEENQEFITFVIKNIHSGFNKVNWNKTISKCQAYTDGHNVAYLEMVNKKKQINYDEELFVIFYSILNYLHEKHGFVVNINFAYELMEDDLFESYLDGYGATRLEQIRYKYFSDKMLHLWQLCYDFFSRSLSVKASEKVDDYLMVQNFNIVFEAMVDNLLSSHDKRIKNLHLREQLDGKRVDHIYAYDGLIHNQKEIYYIGDSKYYKFGNMPDDYSKYKQYTYARNVIQANLNIFNKDEGHKRAGEDYLVYLDEQTEGYNITPNFFIMARIPEDRSYDRDNLEYIKSEEPSYHFKNRLFDRDTLLLQYYNVNFLYILSVYGSGDDSAKDVFRKKARKNFKEMVINDIEEHYHFFSLQLKSDVNADNGDEGLENLDKMGKVIESKYFHKLLGKAYRPYEEHHFLYLALDSDKKNTDDNFSLLSDLSKDFNIRSYALNTDPKDEINTFYQKLPQDFFSLGDQEGGSGTIKTLNYRDFPNEVFLIGGYRTDKEHLSWIKNNYCYNVRYEDVKYAWENQRHGVVQTLNKRAVSVRFLILYDMSDEKPTEYTAYMIRGYRRRDEDWMRKKGYDNPHGEYLVYTIEREVSFADIPLNDIIESGLHDMIDFLKKRHPDYLKNMDTDDLILFNKNAPILKLGSEIEEISKGEIWRHHSNNNPEAL